MKTSKTTYSCSSPGVVREEVSVFCYHDRVHFLERFYRGDLALKPAPRQGFALVAAA